MTTREKYSVLNKETGELIPLERAGTVKDLRAAIVRHLPIDRTGDRTRYGSATDEFKRQLHLRNRGGIPMCAEEKPPKGWAAEWFGDVLGEVWPDLDFYESGRKVPNSGVLVAQQLARLAGDGAEVTIPIRSLADAVGRTDSAGRYVAYTQSGIDALIWHGFLEKEVTGKGQKKITTYRLLRPSR